MPSAQQLRAQIESNLAKRFPSALTPLPRITKPVASTGLASLDELLQGGYPVGAITELVGAECSGRTSLAIHFVAGRTQAGKVCAWVDVSDAFHPESAAALGVDLSRLLWTRCGVHSPADSLLQKPLPQTMSTRKKMQEKPAKVKPGLPQGGSGHPRMEAKGLSSAVSELLGTTGARCAEAMRKPRPQRPPFTPEGRQYSMTGRITSQRAPIWRRLDQALRVTDLLLQAGGFNCIVLDMGSLGAEYATRVPLATWFRFRAAAERQQLHLLLLTQNTCAKSSAGLVLHLSPANVLSGEATIFSGFEHRVALQRQRFPQPDNVLPIRKPPQSTNGVRWQSKAVWAGR